MTDTISGSFIMTYVPGEDDKTVGCKISLVGWRGEKSCRLYIGKHDRVHYLHLLGKSISTSGSNSKPEVTRITGSY